MLKTLRRFVKRSGRPSAVRSAQIEGLEKRSLLSAGTLSAPPVSAADGADVTPPTVVSEQLIGGDPRGVLGVRITFSEALDPATAVNLKNYRVGVRTDRRQQFIDQTNQNFNNQKNKRGLIKFETPVYDPATFSVTLTAIDPFNITRRFRAIRVLGRDATNVGIRDASGNVLDGNLDGKPAGDSVTQYTFSRGHHIRYQELDSDNVALSITGPGRLWVIRHTKGGKVLSAGNALRVYIDGADPATSIVTGKVSGIGNGVAVIEELVNTSTAQVQIASDPAFQIVTAIP